jgi:hypothetical protein
MRRREAMGVIGGAVAWPLAAHAQQTGKVARIGYLAAGSHDNPFVRQNLDAFRQGLRDLGHVEGQNIAIVYRFAEGDFDRLHDLAAELVRLEVAVIVAAPTPAAVRSLDLEPHLEASFSPAAIASSRFTSSCGTIAATSIRGGCGGHSSSPGRCSLLLGARPRDHARDQAVVEHPGDGELARLDAALLGVALDLLRDLERLRSVCIIRGS